VADDLLSIGQFARLSGLSVGALRHYDELDLLRPADIDRFTGYRRYRAEQLETARVIARLRELEMSLDEIREVVAIDDPAERQRRLERHRARIEARTHRLQRVLHHVTRISKGDPIVKRPPVAPEEFPDPAGAIPNSRVAQVTDVGTTTFRFDCLNVFTNAAVDAAVPDAPPLQRGLRIRFFSVVTRPQAAGGDSLVFLREVPIDASGAVHVDDILADAPAFEQLVDSEGRVVRSPRGPAHVAGFNFGRLGAGTKCVGCHTGHSTIPVPTNNWRAKWFNAAPSAEVTATSAAGNPRAAVDRRTRGPAEQVAWVAGSTRGERIRLSWRTPVEVRAVVLYSVHSEPSEGTNQRIRETELDFLREGVSVKHLRIRRDLSPKGTRIDCEPVLVDAIEIAPTRVTGLVGRRPVLALAEIEAIARLLED